MSLATYHQIQSKTEELKPPKLFWRDYFGFSFPSHTNISTEGSKSSRTASAQVSLTGTPQQGLLSKSCSSRLPTTSSEGSEASSVCTEEPTPQPSVGIILLNPMKLYPSWQCLSTASKHTQGLVLPVSGWTRQTWCPYDFGIWGVPSPQHREITEPTLCRVHTCRHCLDSPCIFSNQG